MNLLQRVLVEKTGYENGFENSQLTQDDKVCLSSARHSAQAIIDSQQIDAPLLVRVSSKNTADLIAQLRQCFQNTVFADGCFIIGNIDELTLFLNRASEFAQLQPNQTLVQFQQAFNDTLKTISVPINGTEIERMVKQRIGQEQFRAAMLDYWGNACAVTGISVTETLKASHAKPWAECETDEERLDIYNGFLLCANLDALFDRFLISFDDNGLMLISSNINPEQREKLGLNSPHSLRWLTPHHLKYLSYHRNRFVNLTLNHFIER